jgi:hypothetical protein
VRKLALSAMGDRVGRAAPKAAGKEKGKERQEARDKRAGESMARGGPPVGATSAPRRRPRRWLVPAQETRETQAAVEELLASVPRYLGAPPRELVVAAADEVLALVKDRERSVALEQGELRKLLGRGVDDAAMTSLLRVCERITDYAPARPEDAEAASQQPEQDAGVAVFFLNSDEDEDSEGRLSVVAEPSPTRRATPRAALRGRSGRGSSSSSSSSSKTATAATAARTTDARVCLGRGGRGRGCVAPASRRCARRGRERSDRRARDRRVLAAATAGRALPGRDRGAGAGARGARYPRPSGRARVREPARAAV